MDCIELYPMKCKKDQQSFASKWTYHTSAPRFLFSIRRSNYDEDVSKCPVERFEMVKISYRPNYSRDEERVMYGVVTNITQQYKYKWRNDYQVSVKRFENLLDAIEYSEKKKQKYLV